MNLKTYRARSMAECLTEVKKDLGGDAVILRTRSYKVGGMMGLGGRPMVEITASNDPVPNTFRPASRPQAAGNRPKSTVVSSHPELQATGDRLGPRRPETPRTQGGQAQAVTVKPDMTDFGGRLSATARSEARVETAVITEPDPVAVPEVVQPQLDGYVDRIPTRQPSRRLVTPVQVKPVDAGASVALQEELASIKRMVGQVLRVSRRSAMNSVVEHGGMPEPLFNVFRTLTDQGLESDLVDQVLAETRDELDAVEIDDAATVETAAANRLAALIPVAGKARDAAHGDAKVVAVVGPTGVGKTTTIAKLAATLKLRHQRRVGLITCDTYRIAAVEQLRVYADIIGLELKVAMSPQEARRHRQAMNDCDVVLVDTAGRSPHDDRRLEELREYIDVLEPEETHLVLSLAAAEGVMNRAAERFAALRPDRLLMTKLDESVAFGPMVNLARALSLPIGYVTTGQEVPDQFERADAARLARVILRGGGGW